MVFSNVIFLFLFLPVTVIVYYLMTAGKASIYWRNVWLLLVSLLFYAWGEPLYVLLMLFSILVNHRLGIWESDNCGNELGKQIVAIACVFNLGILFCFKYLSWILSCFGLTWAAEQTHWALPIGISFYTFQSLSYIIDIYREKDKAQRSIVNTGLYIAFFPQLIAGPIVRYELIAKQLTERIHSWDKFAEGAWRFTIGLSKKIILANQLAELSDYTFFTQADNERTVILAWVGCLAFMFQLYFDFSGYSDMAIGLGKMFGFELPENFNYPYVAKSVSEYWRRWHITLGGWFRDYLYYPVSMGSALTVKKKATQWMKDRGVKDYRKKSGRVSMAYLLFIVWMSTGMWHGANGTFVVWGFIQFVFIYWEQSRTPLKNEMLGNILGLVSTYFVILITKVVFNATDLSHAMGYYGSMLCLTGNSLTNAETWYWLDQFKVILIAGFLLSLPVVPWVKEHLFVRHGMEKLYLYLGVVVLTAMLLLDFSYAIGGAYNPFIYFNF